MPYAVHVFFDTKTETAIKSVWKKLAETEIAPYFPGQWMPHCTLALELEPRLITPVLDLGLQISLPLNGEITEMGVIEFRPVKHLFGFRL